MKKFFLLAALAGYTFAANAAPSVEGEYLCDGCHGYMTVKKKNNSAYQVWLGIGGGSCGGEVIAKGVFSLTPEGKFAVPWKDNKGRKCVTSIEIEGNQALVSDSCISPEDENGTTCAFLGEYIKR